MTDTDTMLAELRCVAVPSGLLDLDGAALAQMSQLRARETRRTSVIAATAALLIGVAGSTLPVSPVAAALSTPLGESSPLAPSTLLSG